MVTGARLALSRADAAKSSAVAYVPAVPAAVMAALKADELSEVPVHG